MTEATTAELATTMMDKLAEAWRNGDADAAMPLFASTREYHHRPWDIGTTAEEYRSYWSGMDDFENITVDWDLVSTDGRTAVVHWVNTFGLAGTNYHVDGLYVIEFNDAGECDVIKQWFFTK
ncbi:nuclear transport factor 2 family protein [Microbacterium sp. X-17]|uniref:nuclear transport factor 2 family protein n=1 Tax=Microbacterium sp. X-17 TaxID=3144404 RepID=UPI0031F4E074